MSNLTVIVVPASGKIDPINVYLNDVEPGRGGLLVECFGASWACFWSAMGKGSKVQEFVSTCDAEYVANCLIRARRQWISSRAREREEMDYLVLICEALIGHLKQMR